MTDKEAILTRIDGLRELMDERFEFVNDKLEEIDGSLENMRGVVIGNGKVGLAERVNMHDKIFKVVGGAIVLLATAVVTAVINGWWGL